jgi:hypothetical protein
MDHVSKNVNQVSRVVRSNGFAQAGIRSPYRIGVPHSGGTWLDRQEHDWNKAKA